MGMLKAWLGLPGLDREIAGGALLDAAHTLGNEMLCKSWLG